MGSAKQEIQRGFYIVKDGHQKGCDYELDGAEMKHL